MNNIVDAHQAAKDAEQYNAQRPPDAGPWCACGNYRVPVPTMRCPVCVGVETAEHMAAVAAIGQSSRFADRFRFGRRITTGGDEL